MHVQNLGRRYARRAFELSDLGMHEVHNTQIQVSGTYQRNCNECTPKVLKQQCFQTWELHTQALLQK